MFVSATFSWTDGRQLAPEAQDEDAQDAACARCGVDPSTGTPSCCAAGGSWEGSCSRRNGGGAHTWEDGLDICNPAMLALGDTGRVSKELLAERKRCFELLTQNTRAPA